MSLWDAKVIYFSNKTRWTRQNAYYAAVVWIALNDEVEIEDCEEIKAQISVCLVADTFGRAPESVASDVLKYRHDQKEHQSS